MSMDKWYEELLEHADGFGLSRDIVDSMEEHYDRRLDPLQALIAVMHDLGLCSENGDFGPEWQGHAQVGGNDFDDDPGDEDL